MERNCRNLDATVKNKISASMKQTKRNNPVSAETKAKISNALKQYWSKIPKANPETSNYNTNNNKDTNTIPTL